MPRSHYEAIFWPVKRGEMARHICAEYDWLALHDHSRREVHGEAARDVQPDAWVTEKRRRRQERWEDFPEMMNARGEMERISPGSPTRGCTRSRRP
jgi:hypothetical protein